jgi:hypothetical protein
MAERTDIQRGDEFIELYNRLDDFLKELTKSDRHTSFHALVNRARKRNSTVRRFDRELKEYAELRNAIIHDRDFPVRIIADPREEDLARFRLIVERILSPLPLLPTFKRRLSCYEPADPLLTALDRMKHQRYSQVPVRYRGRLRLLTTEGIAYWLAAQAKEDIISIKEATIGDVLPHEQHGTYLVLSGSHTADDAREAFERSIADGRPRLYTVLVTETGKDTDKLKGLVTPWDLAELD